MKYRLKIALLSAGVLLGYGFGFHHLATGKHCHRRPAAESDGAAPCGVRVHGKRGGEAGALPAASQGEAELRAGFGAAAPIQ